MIVTCILLFCLSQLVVQPSTFFSMTIDLFAEALQKCHAMNGLSVNELQYE